MLFYKQLDMKKNYFTLLLSFLILAKLSFSQQTVMIGPTIYGGIGYGAMIQIPTGGTTVSPIMNLNGGANGSFSYAKPVKAPNGKFYSTVSTGGASSLGGIIEINSDLSSYTLKS
jgi:hypothetical protein